MTYDTRKRILQIGVHEEVELTNLEHKLLLSLSSKNVVTYKEISEYVYGFNDKYTNNTIRVHVLKLRRKSIKIKAIRSVGYRLESEIYFK